MRLPGPNPRVWKCLARGLRRRAPGDEGHFLRIPRWPGDAADDRNHGLHLQPVGVGERGTAAKPRQVTDHPDRCPLRDDAAAQRAVLQPRKAEDGLQARETARRVQQGTLEFRPESADRHALRGEEPQLHHGTGASAPRDAVQHARHTEIEVRRFLRGGRQPGRLQASPDRRADVAQNVEIDVQIRSPDERYLSHDGLRYDAPRARPRARAGRGGTDGDRAVARRRDGCILSCAWVAGKTGRPMVLRQQIGGKW